MKEIQSSRNESSSSLLSNEGSRNSREFQNLQESVLVIFKQKSEPYLELGSLTKLHQEIRCILDSKTGPFLFDFFQTQILSSGINCLKERFSESLTQNKTLIKCLTETWRSFFRGILPTLDEIFFRVKIKGNLSVRKTALMSFRDDFLRSLSLEFNVSQIAQKGLKADDEDIKSMRHMLLVILTLPDVPFGLSNNFDRLTSSVWNPREFLEELAVSFVPEFARQMVVRETKQSTSSFILDVPSFESLARRPSTPMSPQPKQMETLSQLFAVAIHRKK